jgi:cobalt-precorrin 5A hydrolase
MDTGTQKFRAKIAAFSSEGFALALRIARCPALSGNAERIPPNGLGAWAKEAWEARPDAIVFVSSSGIAVRAVAPYAQSKLSDPAVLNVDEKGNFCVSLLSGHVGGANRLARAIASEIGATAVITTASDAHGLFAVDEWAASMGFRIEGKGAAAAVARSILSGSPVGFFSDVPISGKAPLCFDLGGERGANVYVGDKPAKPGWLALRPQPYAIGVGARSGAPEAAVEEAAFAALGQAGVGVGEAFCVASVEAKAKEGGILAFAEKHALRYRTYSAEELMKVSYPGLHSSPFVLKAVGTDNVAERAALLAAGPGAVLACQRIVRGGATAALAKSNKEYSFEY